MIQQSEKPSRLFDLALILAEDFITATRTLRANNTDRPDCRGPMLFFFGKAYKTYQAVKILWTAGFEQDALVLSRTIFELALQARYMLEDPISRAQLFIRHDPVVRYRWYVKIKSLGDDKLIRQIEERKEDLSQLKAQHDEFESNYPDNKGWWGSSVRWLAEHSGPALKREYCLDYWHQSNLIHSNIVSMSAYAVHSDSDLRMGCYSCPPQDARVVENATLYFLDVISHTSDGLGLAAKDLDVLNRQIEDALKRCTLLLKGVEVPLG